MDGHEDSTATSARREGFNAIHMPKNTATGVILGDAGLRLRLRHGLVHLVAGHRSRSWRWSWPPSRIPSTTTATTTFPAEEVRQFERTGNWQPDAGVQPHEYHQSISTADADAAGSSTAARTRTPHNGTLLGFWIYLMSDCFIFAALFACYAVLGTNYAGGPTAQRGARPAGPGRQHRLAAGVLGGLRLRHAGDGAQAQARDAGLAGRGRPAGGGIRGHWRSTSSSA